MFEADEIRGLFRSLYGETPRLFRAPGRVNLMGEHTDYNEGFVLPMALEWETVVAARPRADRLVRIYSLREQTEASFDLDTPGQMRRGIWLDYIEGVARALLRRGVNLNGADLLVASSVPVGAGLSSSAALEIATGLALSALAGATPDPVTLALAGQEAEHTYVGAQVGIMDQLTATLGNQGHALLIDCRSLTVEPVPFDTSDTAVVICNTKVKHDLATSSYNTRRQECEQGVKLLQVVLPHIRALRDVSGEEFALYQSLLPEPIRRRCRHIITENARVLAAAQALRQGRLADMGRLMFASHASMRDDFEISCPELDLLVDLAARHQGVWGARMTGGGFGGCTVNLVARAALEDFCAHIAAEYPQVTYQDPAFYVTEAAAGACEILASEVNV